MRYIAACLIMIAFLTGCKNDTADVIANKKLGVVAILTESKGAGGVGTGYFIDENVIVTNFHVAGDPEAKIKVTMENQTANSDMFEAELVYGDKSSDVAVIKIKEWEKFKDAFPRWTTLKWAKKPAKVGETVWVIGHPWGLFYSVSKGIVSYEGRKSTEEVPTWWIQTDAHVYQGNSGGPMLNEAGNILGMNSVMLAREGGSYGFALPSSLIVKVIEDLKKYKEVRWATLGIIIDKPGVTIKDFAPDSAAKTGGLQIGDQIISVATEKGNPVETLSATDLVFFLSELDYEQKIRFVVKRKDQLVEVILAAGYKTK